MMGPNHCSHGSPQKKIRLGLMTLLYLIVTPSFNNLEHRLLDTVALAGERDFYVDFYQWPSKSEAYVLTVTGDHS